MDKLDAMQTFIRVVDAGTFTRAADLLNLPKSTVTRQIQALERHLAVKLLHRSSRHLSVTEEGAAYYQGAQKLLDQVGALESGIAGAARTPQGKIRVELPGSVAYHLVIPALPRFFAAYPQVQVELSVGNRSVDLIAESVDCVIRVGPLMNDALIARPLGVLAMVTCATPTYLAMHGHPGHPQELARGHTLIQIASPKSGRAFDQELYRDGAVFVLQGTHQVSVNDSTAALMAGLAGLGVLTTYGFLVERYLTSGELQCVCPTWTGEQIPVHVAYPESRHVSSKVRVFLDWVTALFAKGE